MNLTHIRLRGKYGAWSAVAQSSNELGDFALMQSDAFGAEAPRILVQLESGCIVQVCETYKEIETSSREHFYSAERKHELIGDLLGDLAEKLTLQVPMEKLNEVFGRFCEIINDTAATDAA
ncbi:MAG: hypothetical protein IJ766_03800 [Clostridia bacterium]|nr:hypothetical protein [Clostridia bacterium]